MRSAATHAANVVEPTLVSLHPCVGEGADEGRRKDAEDRLHPVAKEDSSGIDTGFDIIFAVLSKHATRG